MHRLLTRVLSTATVVIPSLMLALALPSAAHAQAVMCADGSAGTAGRGACSGHGGLKRATTKSEAKADAKMAKTEAKADAKMAKTEAKADAKMEKTEAKADARMGVRVTCGDGTMGTAGRGACTRHGGVALDDDTNAKGAIAQCKDGMYSHLATRRGACGRHGGVVKWMKA